MKEPSTNVNAGDAGSIADAASLLRDAKKSRTKNLVEMKLSASKLPPEGLSLVRMHFADCVADEAAINREIRQVRASLAAMSHIGRICRPAHFEAVLDPRDRMQLAMDLLLGVKESGQKAYAKAVQKPVLVADANAVAFRGIKHAYMEITGDRNLNFGRNNTGGFRRVSEAIATTDFPNILLDSMFKRLVQDYTEYGMGGLEQVVTDGPALADYRTQSRVRVGFFGDLPTVNEAGLYTELTKPTDEKITYTPFKKGGLLTISEETIRADDLGKIRLFPERLARAGRHTLKTFISGFFSNNQTYGPDSLSWFNAAHNNLITSPLTVDNLIAAEIAQMKQPERDSGNRTAQRISWLMVPVDLASTAWQINSAEKYFIGPNMQVPNPFYKRFGEPGTGDKSPKGIIVNELLTDPNDWFYGVDASYLPSLEIAYLDGISTPQIFLADLQNVGTMFTNDQIQYKAKFAFGGTILDFRGAGKSAVP